MSDRSRTQDILSDILGVQNSINTLLGTINTSLGGDVGSGGLGDIDNLVGINTPFRHGERVIYVDSSNGSGTYDGTTRTTAWRTVQEGLDDSDTTNATDLVLIFNDPGGDGYDINRNDGNSTWGGDVIIVGIGRTQVRIINSFVGATHVLGFENASVYMSNVRLWNGDEDYSQYLLALDGCDGSEIKNCDFYLLNSGNGSYGIHLEDISRVKVEESHFYFEWDKGVDNAISNGIRLNGAHRCEINRCIFDGSHPSVPGGYGINGESGSRQNVFKNNVFLENTIGIHLDGTTENNFSVRNSYGNCAADFTDDSGANWEVCECTTAQP